jgi:hypothetical protein
LIIDFFPEKKGFLATLSFQYDNASFNPSRGLENRDLTLREQHVREQKQDLSIIY